jgi:hypothetical protein
MSRIQPIQNADATANLMKTLAQAPATLEGYLSLSGALATGRLDSKFREQLALDGAQTEVDFPKVAVQL